MTRAIMALVVLALALPATAQAQTSSTNAPPGNSAIDEYLETVPGASGAQRPRPPARKGPGVLTPAQRTQLERQGPDGKTLADAVDATAPAAPSTSPSKDTVRDSDGRAPASAVLDAVTGNDGGGMGFVLPAILVASLLAAIALMLLRRRASS